MDIRINTFLKDFKQSSIRPTRSTVSCPVRAAIQAPMAQTHGDPQSVRTFRPDAQ